MDTAGIHTEHHRVTAGQCAAQGVIPVTLIVSRAIEAATAHANNLKIGYDDLRAKGLAWVLSRMGVEVTRYPGINEHYTVKTWIESWNRRFSERNFEFSDATGNRLALVRSVWAAIDVNQRSIGDLGLLDTSNVLPLDIPHDMEKIHKIPAPGPDGTCTFYPFRYTDIDFNRHVNSVRYLELILNQWDMEHYDRKAIKRLDIAYLAECRYGQTAEVRTELITPDETVTSITREGIRAVAAKILWHDRL